MVWSSFSTLLSFCPDSSYSEFILVACSSALPSSASFPAAALAVERADLAEAEKRLASLKASQAARRSTCSQVAVSWISVKAFAEELKVLADAKQSRIRPPESRIRRFHHSKSHC